MQLLLLSGFIAVAVALGQPIHHTPAWAPALWRRGHGAWPRQQGCSTRGRSAAPSHPVRVLRPSQCADRVARGNSGWHGQSTPARQTIHAMPQLPPHLPSHAQPAVRGSSAAAAASSSKDPPSLYGCAVPGPTRYTRPHTPARLQSDGVQAASPPCQQVLYIPARVLAPPLTFLLPTLTRVTRGDARCCCCLRLQLPQLVSGWQESSWKRMNLVIAAAATAACICICMRSRAPT